MNKLIKIIMSLAVTLVLVNCGKNEVEIDNPKLNPRVPAPLGYIGKTKRIEYSNGGWFGVLPNFNNELLLEVDARGNVFGSGKTVIDELRNEGNGENSICELNGQVKVSDYIRLESLIKSEQKRIENLCEIVIINGEEQRQCSSMIDAGSEFVSLFEDGSDKASESHFLRPSDSFGGVNFRSFFVNPDRVRNALLSIVEDLKDQSSCERQVVRAADYISLSYSLDQGLESEQIVKPGAVVVKKDWTVNIVEDEAILNGEVIIRTYSASGRRYTQRTRRFRDFLVSGIFAAGFELSIKNRSVATDDFCSLVDLAYWINPGTVRLTTEDRVLHIASVEENCYNKKRLVDDTNLIGRINSFIDNNIINK